nr:reverse transcriptase domain-containing protein [Tanacetum cinerariifolium]
MQAQYKHSTSALYPCDSHTCSIYCTLTHIYLLTPFGIFLYLSLRRSLVLGHTQDEANAFVSYLTGAQRILTSQIREIQRFTSTNWRHPWDPYSIYRSIRKTGTLLGEGSRDNKTTKEKIEGCLSAHRSLIKEHNSRGNVSPIRLNFDKDNDETRIRAIVTRKEIAYVDLKKPFKETTKTLLTQIIIEFAGLEFKMSTNVKLYNGSNDLEDHLSRFCSAANSEEWPMPVRCRMFQQTLDGNARGWFEHLSSGSIDGWAELRTQFTTRFSTRRACFKTPTKITKIVRKANETLVAFKERWIVETGFIEGVSEVMRISSFMDADKCPELAK